MSQAQEHYCLYEVDIKNMKTILQGNGDPSSGLCVQIALISQKLDMVIEQLDKKKSSNVRITAAMITAGVAIIIAVMPYIL